MTTVLRTARLVLREFTEAERLRAIATLTATSMNDDEPTAKVTVWQPLQPVAAG